jgi:hypothetical protein
MVHSLLCLAFALSILEDLENDSHTEIHDTEMSPVCILLLAILCILCGDESACLFVQAS